MDFDELGKKKVSDLRYIAKVLGIRSVTTKNKETLIKEITELSTAEAEPAGAEQKNEPAVQPVVEEQVEPKQEISKQENNKQNTQKKEKTNNKTRFKQQKQKRKHPQKKQEATAAPTETVTEGTTETVAEVTAPPVEPPAEPKPAEPKPAEPKPAEPPVAQTAPEEKKSGKSKNHELGEEVEGILEILPENYGFLRTGKYLFESGNKDAYVPPLLIRRFGLRTGDVVKGKCKMQRDTEKYQALFYVSEVNGMTPDAAQKRKPFESLTPIYPDEKLKLETEPKEMSTRVIDLIAPIGKGQRGMIVSPPKAGKTILLKKIANGITQNYPDIKLIMLLIDERPEEVTDIRESVQGDVVSSTFDEMPEKHIKVAELVFEMAQRQVEAGKDVVILMDSLTRLARAYNITIPPTGRSLSGGLDPGAMYKPKRFFGAARNIRGGGSLTIIATALIDTGSKMDDVIFEEFKGTGNMELHLDRKLSEKRIFPAIDINKSGTRKEELLLTEKELNSVIAIRKAISSLGTSDVTEMILSKLQKTKTNDEFISTINILPQS